MPPIRVLLCTSACGLLAACGAAPYIEADGPATATLVVENDSLDPMEAATFVGSDTCSGKRSLSSDIRDGAPHIVKVPGGRPFTVWTKSIRAFTSRGEAYGRLTGVGVCSGSLTFNPLPGRRYVVRIQMVPDKEGLQRSTGSCYASLMHEVRLADGNMNRTRLPFHWRTESACQ